jgi:hypothetical protein
MSRNLGALTLLDPSGPAWPVMGELYLYILPCIKVIRMMMIMIMVIIIIIIIIGEERCDNSEA